MMGGVKRRKKPLNAKEAALEPALTTYHLSLTTIQAALIFLLLFHQGKSKRKE